MWGKWGIKRRTPFPVLVTVMPLLASAWMLLLWNGCIPPLSR
jgi:hypothetical protein